VRRFLVLLVLGLAGIGAAAPSAGRAPAIVPAGVSVGDVYVGGLVSEQARARVRWAYDRPVHFVYGNHRWRVQRSQFGVEVDVDDAISAALKARARATVTPKIEIDQKRVKDYVRALDERFSYEPEDAYAYLAGVTPRIADAKPGLAVRTDVIAAQIFRAVRSGLRHQLRLATRSVPADRTAADFGSIVVIRRGSNSLYYYNGTALVRTFKVATGRSQYPTPLGNWSIVDKQRNPWWRPPDSAWASGLKPIPPGPGNPLGTRWMGLSAAGVGMHGTPDAASVGYSASHGCIRMYVPDAEWLFDHVSIGTPVFIVGA
jgi:lipoprotein-anchoring transpeptidase ErfK/SrfK